MGHQHEGGSELAEPGAERVHPHPLRRHHWGLHKGTGGGVPGVCTKVREAVSLVSLERWRLGAGWVPVLGLPGCRLLRKLRQPWCWCHLVVNQTLLQHSWLMQSVTQGAPGWDLVRRCVLPLYLGPLYPVLSIPLVLQLTSESGRGPWGPSPASPLPLFVSSVLHLTKPGLGEPGMGWPLGGLASISESHH